MAVTAVNYTSGGSTISTGLSGSYHNAVEFDTTKALLVTNITTGLKCAVGTANSDYTAFVVGLGTRRSSRLNLRGNYFEAIDGRNDRGFTFELMCAWQ